MPWERACETMYSTLWLLGQGRVGIGETTTEQKEPPRKGGEAWPSMTCLQSRQGFRWRLEEKHCGLVHRHFHSEFCTQRGG